MARQDIKAILERVRSGVFSAQDERVTKYWIQQFHQDDAVDLPEEDWQKIRQNIWDRLAVDVRPKLNAPVVKLWPKILAVAAAVLLMVFGVYFFVYRSAKLDATDAVVAADIAPGKMGATLTLANGKKIRLSDALKGELAKEAGVVVSKSADGKLSYEDKGGAGPENINALHTLSTAKGETYQLRLPDGSLVWLNAASSLTYVAGLNERGLRRVKLEGEAYFEIFKDKRRPFVVESRGQQVHVLGTHFNVNSYPDEPAVTTTLLEGSVKVEADGVERVLRLGQLALNDGRTLKVAPADVDNVTDWKDGDFFLNRVPFKAAMRKIARWYDMEVVYDASVPDELESGSWISRDNPLSVVLKSIEASRQVKFKVSGRKIYVSK